MDTQKLTCFLLHCTVAYLSRTLIVYWTFLVSSLINWWGEIESQPCLPSSCWIFYFFPVRIFSNFFPQLDCLALLCAYQGLLLPICALPPIFYWSPSPCVWFLGYALLTNCDPPALWTPCLPTNNHMLPQHSSGKLSIYSVNSRTTFRNYRHHSARQLGGFKALSKEYLNSGQ